MTLTSEQQKKVTENMGLVGRVIKDKVHGATQLGIFSYDDLFQIGCIGLCKAAAVDKGGCFSTFAYRLIWNEICDALIYASKRNQTEYPTDPEILLQSGTEAAPMFSNDLKLIVDSAKKQSSGVVAKGIRALELMADGYTCREIGEMMGSTANNVSAWISKARKHLRSIPELDAYAREG